MNTTIRLLFRIIWILYCVGSFLVWIYLMLASYDRFGIAIGIIAALASVLLISALSGKAVRYYGYIEDKNSDMKCLLLNSAKLLSIIITTFSIGFVVYYGQNQFNNEPKGFRNIRWGISVDELSRIYKDLNVSKIDILSQHTNTVLVARRKNEDNNVGGAIVSRISYYFDNDALTSVTLMVYDDTNYKQLKDYCFSEYGRRMNAGQKFINKKIEQYVWKGKFTTIRLSYNPDFKGGYYAQLSYSSSDALKRVRYQNND